MKKYRVLNIPTQQIEQTLCNNCGLEITDDNEGLDTYFDLGERDPDYSYPEPTTCLAFDLCYDCTEDMISKFKIPPEII